MFPLIQDDVRPLLALQPVDMLQVGGDVLLVAITPGRVYREAVAVRAVGNGQAQSGLLVQLVELRGETLGGGHDLVVTAEQVATARGAVLTSFGSCSFSEPRDDLRAAGLID